MCPFSVHVSKKTSFTFQGRMKSSLHSSFWTLAEKDAAGRQERLRRTKQGLLRYVPPAARPGPPQRQGHRRWTPLRPSAWQTFSTAEAAACPTAGEDSGRGSRCPGRRAGEKVPAQWPGVVAGERLPGSPSRAAASTPPPQNRPLAGNGHALPTARSLLAPSAPTGPLTRPGGSRSRRRRRRRPLGPRPSNGRNLPRQRNRSYISRAAGPGNTSFRNRLAPPRSLLLSVASHWAGSPDPCSQLFPSQAAGARQLRPKRPRPLPAVPTPAALSRARAPCSAPPRPPGRKDCMGRSRAGEPGG